MQKNSILTDPLPTQLMVAGAEYPIDTDFRAALLFTRLLQDRDVADVDKAMLALKIFYVDSIPHDLQAALGAIMWYYRCGREETHRGGQAGNGKRVYCFDHDAPLIYSAFYGQYGIDLTVAALHWWTFYALFSGLSADTEFVRVVGYRSAKITKDMSKAEKTRIRRLKTIYALPDNRTEEEKERDFAAALSRL